MWSALRSDLREFVSTVAEESTSALAAIDSQLAANPGEELSNNEVILNDDGNITYVEKEQGEDDAIERQKQQQEKQKEEEEEEEKEVEKRKELLKQIETTESTYTEEFSEEEKQQFEEFQKKKSEGSYDSEKLNKVEVLKENSELEKIFKDLVVEKQAISEEQFWERYFVRCHLVQMQKTAGEMNGEKHEATEGGNIMSGIFKFMEGAAKQLDSNRPPFVLNTAIDDEDDYGWDSDEEEEEEEGKENISEQEEGPSSGQQYNKEEETELTLLKDKLSQVEEERDLLHQTIDLQKNEIADLTATVNSLKETLAEKDKLLLEFRKAPKQQLPQQDDEPSSSSSGVVVSNNDVKPVSPTDADSDGEEDDWGDDAWGDN